MCRLGGGDYAVVLWALDLSLTLMALKNGYRNSPKPFIVMYFYISWLLTEIYYKVNKKCFQHFNDILTPQPS